MHQDRVLHLAAVAAGQHGAFSTEQALAIGFTRSAISRAVKSGIWQRPLPSTYVVSGSPATWERAVSVAVIGTGSEAIASHATAAHLWGLRSRPRNIEVTTPKAWRPTRDFVVHRSTDLIDSDTTCIDGIRVSTVARTLVDVGIPWGEGVAARCLDEAERRSLVEAREVASLLHRVARRGRNGVGPMRQVLELRLGWANLTESQIEDEFLRIMVAAGFQPPQPQVRLVRRGGRVISRVDFDFPEHDLVIYLDGRAYHSDRSSFQRDRRQQNALVLEQKRVLRFTAWDVFAAPAYVVATVAEALRTPLQSRNSVA